ncbi:ATP-dependent DNA helicase UvrD/PcrA [Minicystis rosea]|nr:ATP-dependent DNA helicase UvrD/PcrA [Minicystis rosea]
MSGVRRRARGVDARRALEAARPLSTRAGSCYRPAVASVYDFPPAEPELPEPSIPDDLNEPQRRAVAHVDGPLLIFAGAGSGKTRVIVYRIANLVAVHRVPPYRILAVTFTNKAAGEMKRRLESLIGPEVAKDLWVGTFHSVCVRLLRRYHDAAGLSRNFVIYDDGDQRTVMNRVIKELELDEKRFPPRQVLSRIHHAKQEGKGPEDVEREAGFQGNILAKCFEGYQRRLKDANAVDFDDLLLSVLRIVEDPESLPGQEIRGRFRHVLVDEFQDVNQVQYRLVRALASSTHNLCVVGDDDQSIYRWRGADVRIVRGFRRDNPNATVIKLEQNYRSSGNIVKGALGVIKPASDREPKELWTANQDGESISIVATDNEHDEAAFVVERIRELCVKGVSPREIAVFYRIHAQSRVLEEVMRAERIPYQIIGGVRFFERAEIKDCLSYLRVIDNPKSDVDLLRIINTPSRKIGDTTIEKLVQTADENGTSLYDALAPAADGGALGSAARNAILRFRDLLQSLMADARDMRPSELCEEVLGRTGYTKMLEADDSTEAETRLQNLRELVGSILAYEEEAAAEGEPGTLSGYLERVTLASDVDALEETPRVAMMTVHAAKGLEFEAVFLTGMEEDLFPFRSIDPKRGEDLEEERRLAYVAVTRARRKLWITYAGRRAIFGTTRYGLASRFISDLPRSSVRHDMTASLASHASHRPDPGMGAVMARARGAWSHPQEQAASSMSRFPGRPSAEAPARAPGERYVERDDHAHGDAGGGGGEGELFTGMRVSHKTFGVGVVQAVDPGADPIVTVKFSGYGPKRIKARFLQPGGR